MTDRSVNVLDKGFVRLVDSMGNDDSIVQAARVSYGQGTKTPEEDRKLLKYLLKNKHTSPFEAVQLKFHVKAPIFVFRQWHRHRTWSYNEISARYTELKDEFYEPKEWRIPDPKNKQGSVKQIWGPKHSNHIAYKMACYDCLEVYHRLLKDGAAREMARMVLPVSVYSEMYASVNLHNLMHFITLRDDSHAQLEIQEYARALKQLTTAVVPVTMELYDELFSKDTNENPPLASVSPFTCKCTQCVCGAND